MLIPALVVVPGSRVVLVSTSGRVVLVSTPGIQMSTEEPQLAGGGVIPPMSIGK